MPTRLLTITPTTATLSWPEALVLCTGAADWHKMPVCYRPGFFRVVKNV